MSKKIKMKMVDETGGQLNSREFTSEHDTETVKETAAEEIRQMNDSAPFLASVKIKDEVMEKIETVELLERENARLAAENSGLQDKLAEYIERLETASKESGGAEVAELKAENKRLQDENDSYLMRISSLTFEKARLTASLDEMTRGTAWQPWRPFSAPVQASTENASRQSKCYRNGYSDWN